MIRVQYLDYPEGAQDAAVFSATGGQSWTTPEILRSGAAAAKAYATFEKNCWKLDGSRVLLTDPPAPINAGWWSSSVSDEQAAFSTPPRVTVSFPAPITATGLTFVFSPETEQYAATVQVRWYFDQQLLSDVTANPDATQWVLSNTVEDFNRVVIDFVKTNKPQQFLKLQQLLVGQTTVLDYRELESVNLVTEVDPTGSQLPVDTLSLRIRDLHSRQLAPQDNQIMELYNDDTLIAHHYIQQATREGPGTYKIDCSSMVGLLEDAFLGGIYSSLPVTDLLNAIVGTDRYEIDPQLSTKTLSGYLPTCTKREALQQVLLAICAVATTQGSKVLQIQLPATAATNPITVSQIMPGAELQTDARVARLDVTAHQYTATSTEEVLIQDEAINGSNVLYTFNEPHHSYTITGGTLTESGPNFVRITANGNVKLTAKAYQHTMQVLSKTNPRAKTSESANVVTVEDATLVTAQNVDEVLTRLYDVYLLRSTVTEDIVLGEQQAGEMTITEKPWPGQLLGYITQIDADYTRSGKTAKITVLGRDVARSGVYGFAGDMFSGEEVLLCESL